MVCNTDVMSPTDSISAITSNTLGSTKMSSPGLLGNDDRKDKD